MFLNSFASFNFAFRLSKLRAPDRIRDRTVSLSHTHSPLVIIEIILYMIIDALKVMCI